MINFFKATAWEVTVTLLMSQSGVGATDNLLCSVEDLTVAALDEE